MEIKGKVHCFFEQSGTFKNEFKKLGYVAYDYDIQNNFNETDFDMDLFEEIERCYDGKLSVFDSISRDDLIMAFFPCIYFESIQMLYYQFESLNNAKKSYCERIKEAVDRLQLRTQYHTLLYKMVYCVERRKLRLIIENPATKPHYLLDTQNFPNPTFIDKNRQLRGDYYRKPTAYWFFGCSPTYGCSYTTPSERRVILNSKRSIGNGICSEERSLMSPEYARNFICDFILGVEQDNSQPSLF